MKNLFGDDAEAPKPDTVTGFCDDHGEDVEIICRYGIWQCCLCGKPARRFEDDDEPWLDGVVDDDLLPDGTCEYCWCSPCECD